MRGGKGTLVAVRMIVLSDREAQGEALRTQLGRLGYLVDVRTSLRDARDLVADRPTVVLLDLPLDEVGVGPIFAAVRRQLPAAPVVAVTRDRSPVTAVALLRAGASDVLSPPFYDAHLHSVAIRAEGTARLLFEATRLRARLGHEDEDEDGVDGPFRDPDTGRLLPMSEIRDRAFAMALEECDGNAARAARLLGVGRATLYRHVKTPRPEPEATT